MSLLAVLTNPAEAREARGYLRNVAIRPTERQLLRLMTFPQARTKISGALGRMEPMAVHISGPKGEFVRFRMSDPKKYETFRVMVLSPKELRGLPVQMARRRLGPTGLRRLTLGVIGRLGPGRSELQSVLVPKVRVFEVARQFMAKPGVRRRIAVNPIFPGALYSANKSRRMFLRNAPDNGTVSIPFRPGGKYSPVVIERWVAKQNPAIQQRWSQAVAQYRRFHKGSLPKTVSFNLQKLGVTKGITDVEFGVSEGKEWMAPYQVPAHSGKFEKGPTAGRFVHAHGDSQIDVDIKRPASTKKLPDRFHTPDGKFVGVIPKYQKITDWYRH